MKKKFRITITEYDPPIENERGYMNQESNSVFEQYFDELDIEAIIAVANGLTRRVGK